MWGEPWSRSARTRQSDHVPANQYHFPSRLSRSEVVAADVSDSINHRGPWQVVLPCETHWYRVCQRPHMWQMSQRCQPLPVSRMPRGQLAERDGHHAMPRSTVGGSHVCSVPRLLCSWPTQRRAEDELNKQAASSCRRRRTSTGVRVVL